MTRILYQLLSGHYHLWFVPMVIGFYLLLPILRLWVKEENRRYIRYFLILWFIFFHLIPQLQMILGRLHPKTDLLWIFPNSLQLDHVMGYTGYFLLGWYLHTAKLPEKAGPWLWLTGITSLTAAILGTWGVSVAEGVHTSLYGTNSALICIWSLCIFCLIKKGFGNKAYGDGILCRGVSLICRCSLGIYAVHVAVIAVAYSRINPFELGVLHCVFTYLFTVIGSVLITLLLKKLPILKKVV